MSKNLYFVPFCDRVIRRYESYKDLPSHGRLDDGLYSGKISVTLTARTAVMVGGENRVWENGQPTAVFSKDPREKYRIPGSSFRGLIRQNMQILGLGAICTGPGEDIPGGDKNRVHGKRDPQCGLPASHRKNMLDYPHSIMGFVFLEEKKQNVRRPKDQKKQYDAICYRSRVSVGDLTALGRPMELNTRRIDQRLPRQDDPDFITELPDGSFRLNGFRQYPPRTTVAPESWRARQGMKPLDEGTRFSGVIRYRNLHIDELGLLLWCLRLEEGCVQTIGMGKAEGYGQMELKITGLVEYDSRVLYGSLTGMGTAAQNTDQRVEELIRAYRSYAAAPGRAGQDPAQMDHIKTFFRLRRGC